MLWLKRIFYGIVGLLLAGWLAMVGYAYWPTGITEVPARTLADPGDQFVNVNGLELRYHTWGEPAPDKPVAVLLHGFGNSLQSFRLVAPLLSTHYYVIAVDMPGYGLSAKPVDFDYQNPNQAQMMKDFIRALGLKNVVVGGHSLGGAIAFRVALDNPDVIIREPAFGIPINRLRLWVFLLERLARHRLLNKAPKSIRAFDLDEIGVDQH